MKANRQEASICPKCGSSFTARPAVSRDGNKTLICPKCGTREALEAAGMAEEAIRLILESIYNDED